MALLLFFSLRLGPPPSVTLELDQAGIGQRPLMLGVQVVEPRRGLGRITVEAIQGDRVTQLADHHHQPAPAWAFWRQRVAEDRWSLAVGRDTVPGLSAGQVTLRVSAQRAGTWFSSGAPVVVQRWLPVRFEPPGLAVRSSPNRVSQGGAGLVVYRLAGGALDGGAVDSAAVDGVMVGEHFFPGHALPAGVSDPGLRFALFAIPFDLNDRDLVRLVAVDALGNRAETAFLDAFKQRPPARDTIRLNDAFFEATVPEILDRTPSIEPGETLLASFLAINGTLRRENDHTLEALAASSRAAMLWSGAFRQLPGSQVMSSFADRRTYVYRGRTVDHQDHLGYDLASVRRAMVPAANRGVVVLARYLGIYGNTVVLDHGFGLMTLYSHLSSIAVGVGQEVAQDTPLGRTGKTGLAAGDHLHFTTLIGGVAVDPLEWLDGRWIASHITAKLDAAIATR